MSDPYATAGDIRRALADCARGCLLWGQHHPNCPDQDTCDGCLPRPAEIGHYCQKCAFALRDLIADLPRLITGMYLMPGGQLAPPDRTNNGDPSRRGTKVDQLSLSPAHDAADEAARWLHSWAVDLADLLAERGPFEYRKHDGIPVPNPKTEARYLTSRLAQLCSHPAVNDLNDEARQLSHRLTRTTGSDEADQRIPVRCPNCNQRSIIRPNGKDIVQCRNRACGQAWSLGQFELLTRKATA